MIRGSTLLFALALAVAACGGEGENQGSEATTARDSAGVRVVHNGTAAPQAQWGFTGAPLVEIGAGAEDELVNVTGAVRVGGSIVVADGGAKQLRFYNGRGELVRTAGREGQGPGEFEHIGWVGALPGDSVGAWDTLLKRISIFSADGQLGRVATVHGLEGSFPAAHGAFGDGSLLIGVGAGVEPKAGAEGVWRDSLTFFRVSSTGSIVDTLGRFSGAEQFEAPSPDPNTFRTWVLPFGRATMAAAHGNAFYISTGDGYAWTARTMDGAARLTSTRAVQPAALTAAEIAEYRSRVLAATRTSDAAALADRRRTLDITPYPKRIAPISAMRVDEGGRVWVQDARLPSAQTEGSTWSVFDANGTWMAQARAPARFTVYQIGPDWVLGRHSDEDGVDRVRIHRLEKR